MKIQQKTQILLVCQLWPHFDDKIQKKKTREEVYNGSYCRKLMESQARESMVTARLHSDRRFQN